MRFRHGDHVDVGFKPENIIIVGRDSAGANLALALARYLITYSNSLDRKIGVPGGLVLLSPWAHLTPSHAIPDSSEYMNARSDFPANEYISPASRLVSNVSFKGFPRSIIVYGDAETLVDSIRTLENG